MKIVVDSEDKTNIRLDLFLKDNFNYSRSYIEKIIEEGFLIVSGSVVTKPSYKTKLNDEIEFTTIPLSPLSLEPQNIPLNILYEDEDILIVDKERGMVVHPSYGHEDNTLVNAILYHCKGSLSSINGVIRPGIVHRIDKDTSGILCICKNDEAHIDVSRQFEKHTNIRKYKCIVKGIIKDDTGTIDKPIGRDKNNRLKMAIDENGKNAITKYKVIERYDNYTFIECELLTGRTHQIRVHMKEIGHPLLGDLTYGRTDSNFKELDGQILHAYYLKIVHPRTHKDIEFISELPDYFKNVLQKLDGRKK